MHNRYLSFCLPFFWAFFHLNAATFPVTVFTDTAATAGGSATGAGDGAGTPGDLRAQIIAANSFAGTGNTITFQCATLPATPCTITLGGPLPPIESNLTIDGGAPGNIVIDGNNAYRVFFADTGTITLTNLLIRNATAQGGAGADGFGPGGGGAGFGAGVFVNQASAVVSISNTTFVNCNVAGGKGGNGNTSLGSGGGGGMGFAGGTSSVITAGGGGGGMTGPGQSPAALSVNGGNGGAGGGGGGGAASGGTGGAGGVAYGTNSAGVAGADTTVSGNYGYGGFGGGGGGGGHYFGSFLYSGGFGGGGGGDNNTGSDQGGAGGFGGGGGGAVGEDSKQNLPPAVGGIQGGFGGYGNGSFGNPGPGGGGGGAAAGPAIFVNLGSVTIVNSNGATFSATGGLSGSGAPGSTAGGADATPVFNFGGSVNSSATVGPIAGALPAAAIATHFSVVSSSYSITAGTSVNVTVTALDSTNAPVIAYNGAVHFTSTDDEFVSPANLQLAAGTATIALPLARAGSQTITATDPITLITGTTDAITVGPAAASQLVISVQGTATPGTPFNFVVQATDGYGNTAIYTDVNTFSSTDGSAVLPANAPLVNGVQTFTATLNTLGYQTITVASVSNPAIHQTSNPILLGSVPPVLHASFNPATVVFGGTATLTVTVTNSNAIPLTGISVSVSYAGVALDSIGILTCGFTGETPGSGTIAGHGLTLAANASCGVSLIMQGTVLGPASATVTSVSDQSGQSSTTATLTVGPLAPTIRASFTPASISVGGSSTLSFTITNPNSTASLSGIGFTDTLPAGLVVSTPNGATGSCTALSAPAGGSSVSLSGVSLAAAGTCVYSVSVTAASSGTFHNTTSAITSVEGGTGRAASASLTVQSATPPALSISPGSVNLQYAQGMLPASFTENISVTTTQSTPFTATSSAAWLVAPAGGTAPGTYTITVNPAGLAPGVYLATLVFSSNSGSAQGFVTLTVTPPPTLASQPSAAGMAGVYGTTNATSEDLQLSSAFVNAAFTAVSNAPWLTFTASSGSTPATLHLLANPAGLAAAVYQGSITVTVPGATNSPYSIPVRFIVAGTELPGQPDLPGQSGLMNSASAGAAAVAPNTVVTLYGAGLGCTPNAQVLVNGIPAQILFQSATQINFVIPGTGAAANPPDSASIQVICNGAAIETVAVPLAAVDPAIFTQTGAGSGQGSVLNQDGSVNGAGDPAAPGSYISVYGTGFGVLNPAGADGLQRLSFAVTATIGGVPANVVYAGQAPGETSGLQQINVQVPSGAPVGVADALVLTANGVNTQAGVAVAIQ